MSSAVGIVKPRVFAVLRLTASFGWVGCPPAFDKVTNRPGRPDTGYIHAQNISAFRTKVEAIHSMISNFGGPRRAWRHMFLRRA